MVVIAEIAAEDEEDEEGTRGRGRGGGGQGNGQHGNTQDESDILRILRMIKNKEFFPVIVFSSLEENARSTPNSARKFTSTTRKRRKPWKKCATR